MRLTPNQSARHLNLRSERKPDPPNLDSFIRVKSSALGGSSEYFAPLRGPSKLPPVSREEQRQWDRAHKKGSRGEQRNINRKDFDPYSGRPLARMDISSLPNSSVSSPTDVMITMSNPISDTIKSKGYKRSDFEFVDCVGRGSCARIMLATLTINTANASDRRPYAVKVMNKCDLVKIPNGPEAVLNERNILRTLSHHFIVPYVDSFQDELCVYIVMEFIPFNLRALLEREKRLNENAARFYAAECAVAIDWLHSKGVLYRDLKPDNVLIDIEGHIKLCDFGAAERRALDGSNAFAGTGIYMAPEVVLGCHYGKTVDWWGLGSLVYELLAGQAPFARAPGSGSAVGARADPETFLSILDAPLYLPKSIFSEQASDLVLKLLCRQPDKRLGSRGGLQELRCHAWFKYVPSWMTAEEGGLAPPFLPNRFQKVQI
ncbi:kinase-like domain-containing protein [Chytridium lagenaria]|nr:kinase-like domain-containing protein [Chytridium lagenaria]